MNAIDAAELAAEEEEDDGFGTAILIGPSGIVFSCHGNGEAGLADARAIDADYYSDELTGVTINLETGKELSGEDLLVPTAASARREVAGLHEEFKQ